MGWERGLLLIDGKWSISRNSWIALRTLFLMIGPIVMVTKLKRMPCSCSGNFKQSRNTRKSEFSWRLKGIIFSMESGSHYHSNIVFASKSVCFPRRCIANVTWGNLASQIRKLKNSLPFNVFSKNKVIFIFCTTIRSCCALSRLSESVSKKMSQCTY